MTNLCRQHPSIAWTDKPAECELCAARARVAELEAVSWCQRLAAIALDCTVPGCDSERPTCSGHRAVAEARAALRGKDGE